MMVGIVLYRPLPRDLWGQAITIAGCIKKILYKWVFGILKGQFQLLCFLH